MAAAKSARSDTARNDMVLSFAGQPDEVEGFVPVDPSRRRDLRVSIVDDEGGTEVRALTAPAGGQTFVRLALPPTFPAGEVDAVVRVGDEEFAAVVRTVAVSALEAVPSDLDITVSGGEASAAIQVMNAGNVAVELPNIAAFGLMTVGGLDGAIGVGLRAKRGGVDRLGDIADALADAHGGLVRVAVKPGTAHLEPGASTQVQLSFRPSSAAKPGTQYQGVLPILDLRIGVRLRVETESTPAPTVRKRTASKKGATQ